MLSQKIPTKPDSSMEPSPAKKRKVGVSLSQKQALIDNLQLESELLQRYQKRFGRMWRVDLVFCSYGTRQETSSQL